MMLRRSLLLLGVVIPLSMPGMIANAQQAAPVDADPAQVLRQMSDYLGSLLQFTFRADNSTDIVLPSGQQLQIGAAVEISVRRPDRFHVARKGDNVDQVFFYDGKTLTLFGKKRNVYATLDARSTLEKTLNMAMEKVGLVAPVADLIYQNTYDILMEDVDSGLYVGLSMVDDVECHHLAFRGGAVDWQIWIENDDTPLPRKYVITSKWISGAPQFSARLSAWNVAAELKDERFRFTPPTGAEKIEFLPLSGSTLSQNDEGSRP